MLRRLKYLGDSDKSDPKSDPLWRRSQQFGEALGAMNNGFVMTSTTGISPATYMSASTVARS